MFMNYLKIKFKDDEKNIKETNIPVSSTSDFESDFREALSSLPIYYFKNWEKFETTNWVVEKKNLIENNFDFWKSVLVKPNSSGRFDEIKIK